MKTRANDGDVRAFLAGIAEERRREDARRVTDMMAEVSGEEPVMWGPSIIGFGGSEYTNTTGTHAWFRMGLSPRKANLSIYPRGSLEDYQGLLDRLGPHSTSKGCLYIKDLRAVDEAVLREIIVESWEKT
jgi:hypothetical protein